MDKADMKELREAAERAPRWRDVADELPREAQEVLFVRGEKTVFGAWIGGIFWHNNQKMAAAYWMPLPLPPNDRIQPRRVGVEKNETAHGNKDRRGDGEKGMTSDAVAGNMCPFCRAILGAPHEGWCTHARPDAVPPRVDVSALQSEIERLRDELAECREDAENWRAYAARKRAVIDAGMGKIILRDAARKGEGEE